MMIPRQPRLPRLQLYRKRATVAHVFWSINPIMEGDDRPSKRIKLLSSSIPPTDNDNPPSSAANGLASLHRSITPPPSSRSRKESSEILSCKSDLNGTARSKSLTTHQPRVIASPFQLTHIRGLSAASGNNVETVQLRDILGDPMIRECWQFNYLFDVDFLISQFDEDTRGLVEVKVVHGSWKKDAPNRIRIDEACSRYPNVETIVAYMPEPFGTHHSKMMILLRHDDLAQVVIHTSNMIPGDWANMCQAVWRSPLLPLQKSADDTEPGTIGTGSRFKRDLLEYLNEYGTEKTGRLVRQLVQYDFTAIRAALVASVPSKQKLSILNSQNNTLWGWPALKDIIRRIPLNHANPPTTPHIVTQISSIASLGQTDKWLKDGFFESLSPSASNFPQPKYSIIFPTPDDIRRSLNGYGSGGSIHMKLQSAPQQKQLQYMRPYLSHWAGDEYVSNTNKHDAGRRRAAPHIKTYIRFSNAEKMDTIDWAMVTSANLSTQAWGAAANANGEVRICSWEIGVIVWPHLFGDGNTDQKVSMVPCFKRDLPVYCPEKKDESSAESVLVGLRMPYDLPLTAYRADEVPWCNTATHTEPDWLGQTWEG